MAEADAHASIRSLPDLVNGNAALGEKPRPFRTYVRPVLDAIRATAR
jgi:hypothetical protein